MDKWNRSVKKVMDGEQVIGNYQNNDGLSGDRLDIAQSAFDDVIEFYNVNVELFKAFEDKYGFDLWFLKHFKIYMTYRNSLMHKEDLKNSEADELPRKNANLIFQKAGRIISEIFYLLVTYRSTKRHEIKNKYAILSYASDIVDGRDKSFGDMDLDVIFNRVVFDFNKKISLKDFASKNMISTDSILLDYVFSFRFIKDLFRYREINKMMNQISEKVSLDNQKYRTINSLIWNNKPFFFIYFLRYRSFDIFLKNSGFKGMLMTDETTPQQKVIHYAARKYHIKIFGFQHGNIHPLHPAYIYGKYNIKPVLPDITFTWGTYFTEFLHEQGGYPINQLKTVGKISPMSGAKKLNPAINPEDKILLHASQPHRDPGYRLSLMKDVLWAAKQVYPQSKLIIRPHPKEIDDDFFTQAADEIGFHNFMVDRVSDLSTHLEICDLLIVAFSTVGTEFLPYLKPMLVLDYQKQDLLNWIKEGVGVPIYHRDELLEKLTREKLEIDIQANKSYIQRYYITGDHILDEVKHVIYDTE